MSQAEVGRNDVSLLLAGAAKAIAGVRYCWLVTEAETGGANARPMGRLLPAACSARRREPRSRPASVMQSSVTAGRGHSGTRRVCMIPDRVRHGTRQPHRWDQSRAETVLDRVRLDSTRCAQRPHTP